MWETSSSNLYKTRQYCTIIKGVVGFLRFTNSQCVASQALTWKDIGPFLTYL